MLRSKHVKASICYYFSTTYAGDVNWEEPSRFDPDSEDLDSWVCILIDTQDYAPSRATTDEGRIVIDIDIRSRKRDQAYETENLLDEVREVLSKGSTIPIRDYDDSDEPIVGYVRINEPVIRDLTQDQDQWRRAAVTIEGRIQEIP